MYMNYIVYIDISKCILARKYDVIICSPEMALKHPVFSNTFRDPCFNNSISHAVMNEAHCIHSWGANFRPLFAELLKLRLMLPPETSFTLASTTRSLKIHLSEQAYQLGLEIPNQNRL
jgi:superfamily II DNA helicase RecQ